MSAKQQSIATKSNNTVQSDDGFKKPQSRKQRRQQQKEKAGNTAVATAQQPKPPPQVTASPKPLEVPSVEPAHAEQQTAAAPQVKMDGNSVGRLQEMCQSRLLPLPCYTYTGTAIDDPSRRRFTCTAQLNGRTAQGCGPSKRQAKRAAANAMIMQMQKDCPCSPSVPQFATCCKAEPSHCLRAAKGTPVGTQTPKVQANPLDESIFQQLRASKRLQSAAKAGAEVDGLFSGVRNRKAGAVLPPIETPSTEDGGSCSAASDQLMELSRVHRFGVKFLPSAESSAGSGEKQQHQQQQRAVVKLSTMPTIVAVGNGNDTGSAREQACRAAMEYLCTLTRESAASYK